MAKDPLQFAMCGDSGNLSPYAAVQSLNCQRILLLINSGKTSASDIALKLRLTERDVNNELEQLRTRGLINETDGKVSPAFPIFALKDQRLMENVIEGLSRDIANVIQRRMGEVENLIEGLSLSKRRLRYPDMHYILVGAMTLDYNGLRVLKEEKLLCPMKPMPGGGNYVFSGLESGFADVRKGWMWGHNSGFGEYWFSSHGRLPKGFRMAFPDLAWKWTEQVGQTSVVKEMEKIGQILEILSHEDLSLPNLKAKTGRTNDLLMQLTVLLGLGYVVLVGEKWRINRPFFTVDDLHKIQKTSESILGTIAELLETNRRTMLEVYAQTSPSKNKIPFEEAFNPLYHRIFEQALDQLIREKAFNPPLRYTNGSYSPFVAVGIENLLNMLGISTP